MGYLLCIEKGPFVRGKIKRGNLLNEIAQYVPKIYIKFYNPLYIERRLFNTWEKATKLDLSKEEYMNFFHADSRKCNFIFKLFNYS